jgi:hypothetical protein
VPKIVVKKEWGEETQRAVIAALALTGQVLEEAIEEYGPNVGMGLLNSFSVKLGVSYDERLNGRFRMPYPRMRSYVRNLIAKTERR